MSLSTMSLYNVPAKVVHTIEKFQRDFLCEGGRQKKDHLIKWESMVQPKEFGGIGMGRIKERNVALMLKWLWRFAVEQDSLWHSIIRSRYGIDANGWNCNQILPRSHSLCWKNIIQVSHLFYPNTRFLLGNDLKIFFWKDIWWGESFLERVNPRAFFD